MTGQTVHTRFVPTCVGVSGPRPLSQDGFVTVTATSLEPGQIGTEEDDPKWTVFAFKIGPVTTDAAEISAAKATPRMTELRERFDFMIDGVWG